MTAPGDITDAPPERGAAESAPPLLSVVVAAVGADHAIDACLTALVAATSHLPADIIVVGPSTADARLQEAFPSVRTIAAPHGTLVPRLWSRGYAATRGAHVAFTLAQCLVGPAWADRLLAALGPGVAGAGGAFTLAPSTGPAAWALFFLRYSAFIEERWAGGPVHGDIAGDNAMYRRSDLEACDRFDAEGFWEVEIHRQLRRRGLTLAAASGAAVAVLDRPSPARVMRERFRHGRRFGAWRAGAGASRLRLVAAAPLVPGVLVWRAARRVVPYARHRRRFAAALPWMLVFAGAWALGEAAGAVGGMPRSDS